MRDCREPGNLMLTASLTAATRSAEASSIAPEASGYERSLRPSTACVLLVREANA
jgi:hypothetical protein